MISLLFKQNKDLASGDENLFEQSILNALKSAYDNSKTRESYLDYSQGSMMHHHVFGLLADVFSSYGWVKTEKRNLGMIVSSDAKRVITVRSANSAAGTTSFAEPNQRYLSPTILEVTQNEKQLILPFVNKPDLYIFMYNVRNGCIYSELSKVGDISDNGRVLSWAERYLLPIIYLDPSQIDRLEQEEMIITDFEIEKKL